VKKRALLALLHEDRMQRPIEILARRESGRVHGADRVDHRSRADRQASLPQRPREMHDVVGDAPARLA
jgi:hypothetical protein